MLIRSRDSRPGLITKVLRSAAGIWFPEYDHLVPKHRNVLSVLGTPHGSRIIPASNIVTDAGDIHYAQRAVSEALTNAFTTHYVATAGTPGKAAILSSFTHVAASAKVNSAGYPLRNDVDADNSGAGADIVTHLAEWTTDDFDAVGITHGLITNTTPATGEPLLTGFAYAAPFDKTASDTLKTFVNHEMSGQ